MIFDIFGSGNSKNPFPGYELKVGTLCSLAAKSGVNNGGYTQTLSIPAGCIPVCVKLEGSFLSSSGKGESPGFYLWVRDNKETYFYYAMRNGGSGNINSNSKAIVLNPLGAYNGDISKAKQITSLTIGAHNGSWSLISDFAIPKMTVTMWLEKIG